MLIKLPGTGWSAHCDMVRLGSVRCCASAPTTAMMYSLLHLGGFDGDLAFYRKHCRGAARVLEFGAGDGRVGAELAADAEYVGVENCADFCTSARERLGEHGTVLEADMLHPLPEGTEPFDTVVMAANTLFCTPDHEALLHRCSEALAPGGLLLFDVYNAAPWHDEALGLEGEAEEGEPDEASDAEDDDLLVKAVDASGREWNVYEREPAVDPSAQQIVCRYDFETASGEKHLTQVNVHHYSLPDELRALLDTCGFEIEATYGGFGEDPPPFDGEESEHLVFAARRR